MAKKKATETEETVATVEETAVEETVKETTKAASKAKTTAVESEYTVEEYAAASKTVFDPPVNPDIVTAAFKAAGKTSATKTEAAGIVGDFLKKEVKVK